MSVAQLRQSMLTRLDAMMGDAKLTERKEITVGAAVSSSSVPIPPPLVLPSKRRSSVARNATANSNPVMLSSVGVNNDKTAMMQQWVQSNGNANTRSTYESGWKGFCRYMTDVMGVNVTNASLNSLKPCDVADYLRRRYEDDGVAAATLAGDRAAIASRLKYTDNNMIHVHPLVADTLKLCMNKAAQSTPKLHMSSELMRDIVTSNDCRVEDRAGKMVNPSDWISERNTTMMMVMMAGMLRESEVVELRCGDVETERVIVDNGLTIYPNEASVVGQTVLLVWTPFAVYTITAMRLHIRESKTDQAKKGAYVMIAPNERERSMCPVQRLWRFQQLRERMHITSEYLFPKDNGVDGMSKSTPCGIVQRAVVEANRRAYGESTPDEFCPMDEVQTRRNMSMWGEPSDYGSHSMRRGGVTEARRAGADMTDIQKHGRWISNAVWGYVGSTREAKMSVTRDIFGGATGMKDKATTAVTSLATSSSVTAHTLPQWMMRPMPPSSSSSSSPSASLKKSPGRPRMSASSTHPSPSKVRSDAQSAVPTPRRRRKLIVDEVQLAAEERVHKSKYSVEHSSTGRKRQRKEEDGPEMSMLKSGTGTVATMVDDNSDEEYRAPSSPAAIPYNNALQQRRSTRVVPTVVSDQRHHRSNASASSSASEYHHLTTTEMYSWMMMHPWSRMTVSQRSDRECLLYWLTTTVGVKVPTATEVAAAAVKWRWEDREIVGAMMS